MDPAPLLDCLLASFLGPPECVVQTLGHSDNSRASWSQPQHLGRGGEPQRDIGGCTGTARIPHTAMRQV